MKDHLVGKATSENKQIFPEPPILRELVCLLRIIVEELVEYRLWPVNLISSFLHPLATHGPLQHNCWFFCSLIQQHLEGANDGWFEDGETKYTSLARDIRIRIIYRVLKLRDAGRTISLKEHPLADFDREQRFRSNANTSPPPSSPSPLPSCRLRGDSEQYARHGIWRRTKSGCYNCRIRKKVCAV